MNMLLIYAAVIFAVASVLAIYAAMRISSTDSRREEKESPCYTCLHWEECNGVDRDNCNLVRREK